MIAIVSPGDDLHNKRILSKNPESLLKIFKSSPYEILSKWERKLTLLLIVSKNNEIFLETVFCILDFSPTDQSLIKGHEKIHALLIPYSYTSSSKPCNALFEPTAAFLMKTGGCPMGASTTALPPINSCPLQMWIQASSGR